MEKSNVDHALFCVATSRAGKRGSVYFKLLFQLHPGRVIMKKSDREAIPMKKHPAGFRSITQRIVLALVLIILPFNIISVIVTIISPVSYTHLTLPTIRLV